MTTARATWDTAAAFARGWVVDVDGHAHIETELARHMGARSVLLLSGATRPEQVAGLDRTRVPDLVLADISELHQLRLAASTHPTGASS